MGFFNFLNRKKDETLGASKKYINYKEIKENGEFISSLASDNLNPYKNKEYRTETFENAYARLGVNEDTLKKVYRNYMLKFYICFVFCVLAIAIVANAILSKQFLTVFSMSGVLCVIVSQMIMGSFRASQINKRELITFKEWLNESENWFPPMTMKSKKDTRVKRSKKGKQIQKYNEEE